MKPGDVVDDFTLPDQTGAPRRLAELLADGPVVLFFYPAAMTPGCTKEACHFRDLAAEFAAAGGQRVGISTDPVGKQARFADKERFDYPLLSDADGAVATAFGETLAVADPAHADEYRANARSVGEDLAQLDRELRDGLADCEQPDLVTSHQAFGYLARRYGFTQLGINGLSPDQEPNPARLAEVTDFVEEHDVKTIYFETLVPADIAQTIADETGADTEVATIMSHASGALSTSISASRGWPHSGGRSTST